MDFDTRYDEISASHSQQRERARERMSEREKQMRSDIDVLAKALAGASARLRAHDVPTIPMVSRSSDGIFGRRTTYHGGAWSFLDYLYVDADANIYVLHGRLGLASGLSIAGRTYGKRDFALVHSSPVEFSSTNVCCDMNALPTRVSIVWPNSHTLLEVGDSGRILQRQRRAVADESLNYLVAAWAHGLIQQASARQSRRTAQ